MTLIVRILSISSDSIMKLSTRTFVIMTLGITTLGIITLNITAIMTLSIMIRSR